MMRKIKILQAYLKTLGKSQIWISSLAFCIGTLITQPAAHADWILHSWENAHIGAEQFSFSLSNRYYRSSENFDAIGNVLNTRNTSYARNQTDLTYTAGLNPRLSILARMALGYASPWGSPLGSSTPQRDSVFGPSDQSLALNYRIFTRTQHDLESGIDLDLQLQGDFPLYAVPPSGMALGDGSTDLTFGVFVTGPIYDLKTGQLKIQSGFGFTQRTLQFSNALPWMFGGFYTPYPSSSGTGILMSLSAAGTVSLKTDAVLTRTAFYSNGSFITGGVNSSLASLHAQVGYQWAHQTQLVLNAEQPFWGQNAPCGWSLGLSFTKTIGNTPTLSDKTLTPPMPTPNDRAKSSPNALVSAKIVRANDRLHLVKIDKGIEDGVDLGQIFDIFVGDRVNKADRPDAGPSEGNPEREAVARGMVTHTKPHEAAIEVREYFKDYWIDEGFIAKQAPEQ